MLGKPREYWGESLEMARLQQEPASLMPQDQLKEWLSKFKMISSNVECPHNPSHMMSFVAALPKLPRMRDDFSKTVVGCDKPAMQGLGKSKMLSTVTKD